jgi:alpha-glucosidase
MKLRPFCVTGMLALTLMMMTVALATAAPAFADETLSSPNGKVHFTFGIVKHWYQRGGAPFYKIDLDGHELIKESNLGIEFQDSGALKDLEIISTSHRSEDSTYVMPVGKNHDIRNHFEEYTFSLAETSGTHRQVDLIFRIYDDGAAFRYSFPKQAPPSTLNQFVIKEELTTVTLADSPTIYGLRVEFGSAYEANYRVGPISIYKNGETVALPMAIEYPGGQYVGITEAELTDYAGMYLMNTGRKADTFETRLAPWPKEPDVKVRGSTPMMTPWRVFMIGDSPKVLVESNLVYNLSAPSVIEDTSWIHPGKVQFPWWNGYFVPRPDAGITPGLNTWTLKHYIDFCAANKVEYHSIDGTNEAWYGGPTDPYNGSDILKAIPEIDLPGVLNYAKSKGVRTRLWIHQAALASNLDIALKTYASWGIEGIMVDFLNRDDQQAVVYYNEILRKTAENHLTLTFHGVFKPTGQNRTYPHLLNHEAVLGTEYNKWDVVGSTPEHEVQIAYVRMMAGPLDVHQGSFRPVAPKNYHFSWVAPQAMGTLARQLAAYVVYENHRPMLADYPEAYIDDQDKRDAFQFVQEVPTTWDETRMVAGDMGKYITIARRAGAEWYLGTMTDRSPRSFELPLSFLGEGKFVAEIYSDNPDSESNPDSISIKRIDVTSTTLLPLEISPAGGNAVRIYQLP